MPRLPGPSPRAHRPTQHNSPPHEAPRRKALGPYAAIALGALGVALAAPLLPQAPFASYFGPLPAPLAMALVAALGAAALARLQAVGWTIPGWPPLGRILRAGALGAVLALPTVVLELALPFPRDINAPLPDALAFYPAIGFVAVTVFHLLPLAAASLVSRNAFAGATILTALVEPAFQVTAGGGLDLRNTIMAVILFGFGLAQVLALNRHGFAAAFAMRIGYYLVWHIAWGAARLPLLFAS